MAAHLFRRDPFAIVPTRLIGLPTFIAHGWFMAEVIPLDVFRIALAYDYD